MNWNWVIPFSGILALAAVAWTIGSSRWFGYASYRDPGKRGFAQSWLGLVVFWLSVISAVVGGALILFLSGYFSPATWQARSGPVRLFRGALRMWVGHDPEILARPGFGGAFGEDGVGVKKRSACGSDMDCPLCC